jgi:hypothetical protein
MAFIAKIVIEDIEVYLSVIENLRRIKLGILEIPSFE